jgi:hypothetical protein
MSVLRHYAQIPTQVKYITSLSLFVNTPGNLSSTTVNAIKFPPGMAPADFITDKYVDVSSNPALFNVVAYYNAFNPLLLKDMGRQLTVLDQYNNHVALFREAQLQQSGSTEGVGGGPADGYGSVWVKVWSPISKVAFFRIG